MRPYFDQFVQAHGGRTFSWPGRRPATRFRGLVRLLEAYVAGQPASRRSRWPKASACRSTCAGSATTSKPSTSRPAWPSNRRQRPRHDALVLGRNPGRRTSSTRSAATGKPARPSEKAQAFGIRGGEYHQTCCFPAASRAVVDLEKLTEYSLNLGHSRGRHKARVFASALGIGPHDAVWLRDRILEAVQVSTAVAGLRDQYGERYVVEFPVRSSIGQARIRTLWIIRFGEDFPRLTSCYVA